MNSEVVENTQTQEEKVEPKLKFERIDISFIYGYVNYNLRKSMPPPSKSNFSEMWAPIYKLNRSADTDGFCFQDLTKDLIKNEPITIISKNNPQGIEAKLSAHILRKRYDVENVRDTDGGSGCLTIKISVENSPKLNTNSIFDILNLAPRVSVAPELSEIKGLEYFDKSEISDKISNFSPIFRLFCNLLYKNQKCWSELYEPPHKDCIKDYEKKCRKCKNFYPFYDIEFNFDPQIADPQIPYMLVEGFLPKKFFKEIYINNDYESQRNYTQEIGSLVGRWLNFENRVHVNTDYYALYKDIDAIVEKDKNIFISRFRDKKTFVVLSSLITLILKCKHFDKNTLNTDIDADKAVAFTTKAILNYLEFSRTRLHNALWLNKQLDKLVNDVDEQETTKEILDSKNILKTLKVKVAKSMNNPISYMWDSVLGQEIPSLKINRNVEKLENDTIQKLNLINEMIDDIIKNSQRSDFSNYLIKNQKL